MCKSPKPPRQRAAGWRAPSELLPCRNTRADCTCARKPTEKTHSLRPATVTHARAPYELNLLTNYTMDGFVWDDESFFVLCDSYEKHSSLFDTLSQSSEGLKEDEREADAKLSLQLDEIESFLGFRHQPKRPRRQATPSCGWADVLCRVHDCTFSWRATHVCVSLQQLRQLWAVRLRGGAGRAAVWPAARARLHHAQEEAIIIVSTLSFCLCRTVQI